MYIRSSALVPKPRAMEPSLVAQGTFFTLLTKVRFE